MNRLLSILQAVLPQHRISRLTGWLARIRARPVKSLLIGIIVRIFRIDLSDAVDKDAKAYPSLNALFTRELAPGARPVEDDPGAVAMPADGVISQCGDIRAGRIVQAKGRRFSAAELLADPEGDALFAGGSFVTIYLAPHDYHRVHVPLAARLEGMRFVPGRLFSVNAGTAQTVDRLFVRNERVVFEFASDAGRVALVMVGAINVGSIETVHAGLVAPAGNRPRDWRYQPPLRFERAQELARFNLGSTVILLFERDGPRLEPHLQAGSRVLCGETVARYGRSESR